jgi:periplasmic divalent cation tolerance protein
MKIKPVLFFITAATMDEARSIGKQLVEKKVAACTNIISGVRSLFIWDKQLCDDDEVLMMVKSRQDKVKEIVAIVKELHSYDVPEIIAIPIVDGSKDYLNWLQESIT